MAKIQSVINKLQELEKKHGNMELTIYHSFDKRSVRFHEDEIYFDDIKKDIYIAIYS